MIGVADIAAGGDKAGGRNCAVANARNPREMSYWVEVVSEEPATVGRVKVLGWAGELRSEASQACRKDEWSRSSWSPEREVIGTN